MNSFGVESPAGNSLRHSSAKTWPTMFVEVFTVLIEVAKLGPLRGVLLGGNRHEAFFYGRHYDRPKALVIRCLTASSKRW